MNEKLIYSKKAQIILVLLRLILGYHFLFEGINKLLSPQWSAAPFLLQANWLFSGFFHYLASNDTLLQIVNFLNIWGQIFIGIGLIAGLFSFAAAVAGAVLMAFYYIAMPPFMVNSIFVDKNLLEFFCFLIIIIFPSGNILGLDRLIEKYRSVKNG